MTNSTTRPAAAFAGCDERALAAELARIAELERVIRSAQAEQFERVASAHQLAKQVEGVTPASTTADRDLATRSFIAELATTLVVHEVSASRMLGDAMQLTSTLPTMLAALGDGRVSVMHVRAAVEAMSTLPPECHTEFDRAAAAAAEGTTASAFRRAVRRLRERLHPTTLLERRATARLERRVCVEHVDDGMAWLSMHLDVEQATAIASRLRAHAEREGVEAPDGRTRAQREVDLAAGLLLGESATGSPLGEVVPRVLVTVPVLTLLGASDEPGLLDGRSPIDAETARRMAAYAPSFRRLLTHPRREPCSRTDARPTACPPTSLGTCGCATADAGFPAATGRPSTPTSTTLAVGPRAARPVTTISPCCVERTTGSNTRRSGRSLSTRAAG